jgi:hypothetical protein
LANGSRRARRTRTIRGRSVGVTITKNYDGSYTFFTIEEGYFVQQRYYGYTKKEATKLFKQKLETRDY